MYSYDFDKLEKLLFTIISQNSEDDVLKWLRDTSAIANESNSFNKFKIAFSLVSRKVPHQSVQINSTQEEELKKQFGLMLTNWDLQRLYRIWMILQIDVSEKEAYIAKINDLFSNAEMNELASMYAALPILAYPESWTLRCAEGVRSNIGSVLDAIILNNPYPSAFLDETAWNQLILKAFFTDKDTTQIIGVAKRANSNLAKSLQDYVAERKAANRAIHDQLWEMIKINDLENK
jgi:hypothetical protein